MRAIRLLLEYETMHVVMNIHPYQITYWEELVVLFVQIIKRRLLKNLIIVYIPSQNILIEYQGLQHYEPIDYFGGEKQFDRQQKHDQLKRDYARKNGYNLIEVPYIEDTYEKIKEYLIKRRLELKWMIWTKANLIHQFQKK